MSDLSDIEKSVMDPVIQRLEDAKGLTDSERGIIMRDATRRVIALQKKLVASKTADYWRYQQGLDTEDHQHAQQADIKDEQLRKTAPRPPTVSETMRRVVRPPQDDPQVRHGHSL